MSVCLYLCFSINVLYIFKGCGNKFVVVVVVVVEFSSHYLNYLHFFSR